MSRLVSYHTDLLVSCFHVHTINKRWILRKSFQQQPSFLVSSKLDTQEGFTLNNTSPRLDLNCRQVSFSVISVSYIWTFDRLVLRGPVRCGFCQGSTPLTKLTEWDL
jgi:hypothetical protein